MSAGHDDGLAEEHEEHANHEAWVIPYADLLTLLMAMFIALFAMSTIDLTKFKALAVGFNEALGGGKLDTGVFAGSKGQSVVPGNPASGGGGGGQASAADGQTAIARLLDQQNRVDTQKADQQRALRGVERAIRAAAQQRGLSSDLTFELQERGLVVRVVTDHVLFDSGQAALKPEGIDVLRVVGEVLRPLDNPLLIEGHTDNVPISTAIYPSNWELSTARAGAVLRFLVDDVGLDPARMRPTGWADRRPIATNATEEGRARNRRVEIVVQSTAIDTLLRGNNLTERRAAAGTATTTTPSLDRVVPDLSAGT